MGGVSVRLSHQPFFWWIVIVVLTTAGYPIVRLFHLWRAKHRFIQNQGAQLQNPQNAEARLQLAHLYALEYIQDAIRVVGENPLYEGRIPYHFLLLLGDSLYSTGRYKEAGEAYERALQAKSDLGHQEALFGLGKAHYRRGDPARALDCYREVLRQNESNLEAYFRLAQAAARQGRMEEEASAKAGFWRVAAALPPFAARNRFRWRLAFLLFPITRRTV